MTNTQLATPLRDHPLHEGAALFDADGMLIGQIYSRQTAALIVGMLNQHKALSIMAASSLSNNLCPDHRDKQKGKPCLACEIERLKNGIARAEQLKAALAAGGEKK